MLSKKHWLAALVALVALSAGIGSMVAADGDKGSKKDAKVDGDLQFQLPPGWTKEDVEKCILAGTPGKQQKYLVSEAGEWTGKTTMWMTPDAPPMQSECTATITPIMDGRFTRVEIKGEMPGMGPYDGLGIQGYDNVAQKYVSSWIDNHSTAIMNGDGKLSDDGKMMTWRFEFHCPLTGKPTVMRQVETVTGSNTKLHESYTIDPKSGKEYKMMAIELTKKS
jgi:hypothetical protein